MTIGRLHLSRCGLVDDVMVSVEGYAAVFNQETVIGGRVIQRRRKLQDDQADVARLPEAWRARC